jgi:predicted ATPase
MLPTSVSLRNYRSFADTVTLELRPITLLFGENNAGKSALLRALPILADSTDPKASGPLDLESPAVRGSSFPDLRWKGIGEDEDRNLGVGFSWHGPEGVARAEYALDWVETMDWRRLVVRRLLWEAQGRLFRADWVPTREDRSARDLTYEIHSVEEAPLKVSLAFQGLLPHRSKFPELDALVKRLTGLQNQVQWLTATRQLSERILPYPTAPRWRLRQEGDDAASVLAASPELLADVSSWYEKHLRRRLRVQEVPPDRFRLTLQHTEKATLDTDLADNGEGTVQVLPVLTALALTARQDSGGPGILALEEPESHLHPSLQVALAERLCQVAAASPSSRIVVETHSEHLLLGVQREILLGNLRPEDVQMYWVRQLDGGQSVAEPVELDREARPQGAWPPGVFSQDTDLARQILEARRKRSAA